MTLRQARARAHRGAKLLDKKSPGWARKVKITELDMGSSYNCVLGQVYGHYVTGMERVFGTVRFGLAITHGMVDSHPDYRRLDEVWKNEIRQRRERELIP